MLISVEMPLKDLETGQVSQMREDSGKTLQSEPLQSLRLRLSKACETISNNSYRNEVIVESHLVPEMF